MSTRACYRFIDPDTNDPEVVTVYKHSDGYPDGAVCWITKALEHAWPLPRFEADEFAAAFVAANKPSAKSRRMDYIAKAEREADPERKLRLLEAAEDYGLAAAMPIASAVAYAWSTEPAATRSRSARPTSSISTT